MSSSVPELPRFAEMPRLGRVCRLGLATRGNTGLDREMVLAAIDRGVNYLNWCGYPDGMRDAIRALGPRRREVRVAVQFEARSAADARRELDRLLSELGTDYLDVATYYYVEHADEWSEIIAPGGAADVLEAARADGRLRAIGLTSHQRPLAAEIAQSSRIDLLMIRYNAAHRGAEQEIFPVAQARGIPVVAFTCLRWGALLRATPADPASFAPPRAVDCYRFVLTAPAVSVALCAPDGASEVAEVLSLLKEWRGLAAADFAAIEAHGARVRRCAGEFP